MGGSLIDIETVATEQARGVAGALKWAAERSVTEAEFGGKQQRSEFGIS